MTTERVQDLGPFVGHSPEQERALGGYAALTGLFSTLAVGFAAWFRTSGRELPERMAPGDLALVAVATHKSTRVIAKDRVASTLRAPFTSFEEDAGPAEVSEQARGQGLRRAIGELIICPYCLGVWVAASLTAGLLVAPRFTRWSMAVLNAVFAADLLQIAYKNAEDTL